MASLKTQQRKNRPRGKPFQKGGDPRVNPGGRPLNGASITYYLRQVLAEVDDEGVTKAQRIAEKAVRMVLEGDNVTALREILERIDGKVTQPISLERIERQLSDDGWTPDDIAHVKAEYERLLTQRPS